MTTLSDSLDYTMEDIPRSKLSLDNRVNPRDPSTTWSRRRLDVGYNRALLGTFVVSERVLEDGEKQWVLLDGGNRYTLMEMAGDVNYAVHCQVFHGLPLEEEARIAAEYNERRQWTGIRKYQARVTMGDEFAIRIQALLAKYGWTVDTATGPGVLRGVSAFERLVDVAGKLEATAAHAGKGTERWNAAMESGKEDAFRNLEIAIDVYNNAFPGKESGQAAEIMFAIALVLLKYGQEVKLERLTTYLRNQARNQRSFRNDGAAMRATMRMSVVDAFAFVLVTYYNTDLKVNSRAALPTWTKTAR